MAIKDKLIKALHQACTDSFYFSDDETSLISAEYLLTVNAAKSIQELNVCFGSPHKIFLEHSTSHFATNCVPILSKAPTTTKIPKSILRNENFDTSRTGKIDIAVYDGSTSFSTPSCAIEVKGFNPPKCKVIDDLARNLEYFSFKGKTGLSKLPATFFIALHSYKNTMSDKKEASNLKRIRKRYQSYFSELTIPTNVHCKLDAFTIRRGVVPDINDPYVQQFGLDGTEDYHFIGVVVEFTK
ncbi:MAG: hypothetical protein OCD00_11040 [Colwellia sp.]